MRVYVLTVPSADRPVRAFASLESAIDAARPSIEAEVDGGSEDVDGLIEQHAAMLLSACGVGGKDWSLDAVEVEQ